MTIERLLGLLTLLAAGLLLAATAMIVGGVRWSELPAMTLAAAPGVSMPRELTGNVAGDGWRLWAAFAAGWLLRWMYGLPWAEMPRAVIVWLLGWRSSVAMLGLSIACVAILLLY